MTIENYEKAGPTVEAIKNLKTALGWAEKLMDDAERFHRGADLSGREANQYVQLTSEETLIIAGIVKRRIEKRVKDLENDLEKL